MNKFLILLITIAFLSCSSNSTKENIKQSDTAISPTINFDWLIGNYQRVNDDSGNFTYETWTKTSETEYLGFGVVLNNMDTIFQENIRLSKTIDGWSFEVTGVDDSIATVFRVTEITSISFISVNLQNEFPTHIQYQKDSANLKASIWGGETRIDFEFIPKK